MTTSHLTPFERTMAAWSAWALEHMPPALRDECHALVEMDPSAGGMRVQYDDVADLYLFFWVGRRLAAVPGDYIRNNLSPDAARRDDPDGAQ